MTNRRSTRMPKGSEIVSIEGDLVHFNVTIPPDDSGYFGRECPSCERIFRMHVQDFRALPEDQQLTCPYCTAADVHSKFYTKQQVERVRGAAQAYAIQMIDDTVSDAFRNMARSVNSQRGMIRMELKPSGRMAPRSLPQITEEAPIRERTCRRCANRYAVFGEHIACPVCGPYEPKTVATDAFEALEGTLAALEDVPLEVANTLRESGAFERTAAGLLGSVVGALETFLKSTFLVKISGGEAIVKGQGNVFQRLDDTADLYRVHLKIDLPALLETGWDELRRLYALRHLTTHNNGVVDARHVRRFPDDGYIIGQHLHVTLQDVRRALALGQRLVDAIRS
jgi:hypothetical protein